MTDKVEVNEKNEVEEKAAKKPQAKSTARKSRTPAPVKDKVEDGVRVQGNSKIINR